MSFRDDEQARHCADLLLARFDLPGWFTSNNWEAIEKAMEEGSNARRTMIGVAWAFFNGYDRVSFADLAYLDAGNMRAVATLLIARDMGPEAVDMWMISDAIAPCPEPTLPPGFEYVNESRTKARRVAKCDGYGQAEMTLKRGR